MLTSILLYLNSLIFEPELAFGSINYAYTQPYELQESELKLSQITWINSHSSLQLIYKQEGQWNHQVFTSNFETLSRFAHSWGQGESTQFFTIMGNNTPRYHFGLIQEWDTHHAPLLFTDLKSFQLGYRFQNMNQTGFFILIDNHLATTFAWRTPLSHYILEFEFKPQEEYFEVQLSYNLGLNWRASYREKQISQHHNQRSVELRYYPNYILSLN